MCVEGGLSSFLVVGVGTTKHFRAQPVTATVTVDCTVSASSGCLNSACSFRAYSPTSAGCLFAFLLFVYDSGVCMADNDGYLTRNYAENGENQLSLRSEILSVDDVTSCYICYFRGYTPMRLTFPPRSLIHFTQFSSLQQSLITPLLIGTCSFCHTDVLSPIRSHLYVSRVFHYNTLLCTSSTHIGSVE